MKDYNHIDTMKRGEFEIIIDTLPEDTPVGDCFDPTAYDIAEIERKIDNGTYEWFILRVRVMLDGHGMGSAYLGGCLYENPKDVLTDGTADDSIHEAMQEATRNAIRLRERLNAMQFINTCL